MYIYIGVHSCWRKNISKLRCFRSPDQWRSHRATLGGVSMDRENVQEIIVFVPKHTLW